MLKQNLLKGILKLVRRAASLDSEICQNPEFASNLENILIKQEGLMLPSVEHTLGLLKNAELLRLVRSTHTHT